MLTVGVAAQIADLKPRTMEGLALMVRVLRVVEPERFKPREENWEDRLALTLLETALVRAGIMIRGDKVYRWHEEPELDHPEERLPQLVTAARKLVEAAEHLAAKRELVAVEGRPKINCPDPADYELIGAWHKGSEAPIRDAFANWTDAVRSLSATVPADGGDWPDRASEDAFSAAAIAEYEARRTVWTTEAYSLRALQMRALAFVSDMVPHGNPLSDRADGLAAGYQKAMVREPLAGPPVHAFMAFSFARDLLRLAEADPYGPRYPAAEPITATGEA